MADKEKYFIRLHGKEIEVSSVKCALRRVKQKTSRCRQALLHIGIAEPSQPSYESKAVFLFIFQKLHETWIFFGFCG